MGMPVATESRGKVLERMIAEMSSRFFMRDFVFKPYYVTAGEERELTDLMLVLNQECIPISVKGTEGEEKSPERLSLWLTKKVRQASKNAKTAGQRLANVEVLGTNLWGERHVFPAGTLSPLCGIALVECSQEFFKPIRFDVRQPVSSLPIHFLSLNDFLNLVLWLGSIWNVFNYFRLRKQVASSLDCINHERALLSYYTLRSHSDFSGFPSEDQEKLEELHQLHLLSNLGKYAERDRLVAHVNAVVHQLHDRHPGVDSYFPPELKHLLEPAERRTAYLKMAAMLNDMPTSNKAWIGRQIEEICARATGQSGCFAFRRLVGNVVFVFAVFKDFNRTERVRALNEFLPAAQLSTGMGEALGVAYDAEDENMGFEVIWRKGSVQESHITRKLATELFARTETLHANPFGDSQPYTPKATSNGTTEA